MFLSQILAHPRSSGAGMECALIHCSDVMGCIIVMMEVTRRSAVSADFYWVTPNVNFYS